MLDERAEEMRLEPRIPRGVLRRARRRRAANAALAGAVTVGLALGAFVGARELLESRTAAPPELRPGASTEEFYPFIYPPNQEELENTREQVADGHMPLWSDPGGVAHLFAVNVMGWDPNDVEVDARRDEPETAVIVNPSFSPDARTTLNLLRVPGPGPRMYAVLAARSEIMDLEPIGPDDEIRPGGPVAFRVRLSVVPPGATVVMTVDGGPPMSAPATEEGPFVVEQDLPEDAGPTTLLSIAVVDGSGNTWTMTSSRVGLQGAASEGGASAPVEAVPLPVAATREAILEAVQSRDWEALRALIPEQGFTFTFGDEDDPLAYWQRLEEEGTPVLPTLEALLKVPHGRVRGAYIWPAPAGKDATEWTEEDLAILDQLAAEGVLTPGENRDYQELGYYYGWRVGIDRDGTWIFFVAGD